MEKGRRSGRFTDLTAFFRINVFPSEYRVNEAGNPPCPVTAHPGLPETRLLDTAPHGQAGCPGNDV